MDITYGSHNLPRPVTRPVLTLGNFDGVHRGHQAIFSRLVTRARMRNGTAVVYTFDPHPATVLAPERPFPLLQTLDQRLATIAACQIDRVIVEAFTPEFAQLHPEAFFATMIRDRIRPEQIAVGYDFTFGSHRGGRAEHLKAWGAETGIGVEIVEPVFVGEALISSTYIRQCVQEGRMRAAAEALGRAYSIVGRPVRGRGVGKQLGFPTVNMVPENAIIPPEGVYITTATIESSHYPAATYIGRNPTFGGTTLVVETYCLDVDREFAVATTEIAFHERLRPDMRFASPEELKQQIAKDVDAARRYHIEKS